MMGYSDKKDAVELTASVLEYRQASLASDEHVWLSENKQHYNACISFLKGWSHGYFSSLDFNLDLKR